MSKPMMVSESCSNHNNDTAFEQMGFEIYPVTIVSFGWGVNIKICAVLWFTLSMLSPIVEWVWVRHYYPAGTLSQSYQRWLSTRPVFYIRYGEYILSSTLMIIALFVLFGIRDAYVLSLVSIMNIMCMVCGTFADEVRKLEAYAYLDSFVQLAHMGKGEVMTAIGSYHLYKLKWVFHFMGWFNILPYLIILYLHTREGSSGEWACAAYSETAPDFVMIMLWTVVIFWALFGAAQFISLVEQHFGKVKTAGLAVVLAEHTRACLFLYACLILLSVLAKAIFGGLLLANLFVT
jgi:hypothetical protein